MSSLASPSSAAGSSVAGVEEIRGHFPALSRRHNGFPVAYFDGPGGTQVPRQVAEAMTDYLLNHNANTNWAFPTSEETDHALLEARRALADWIGGSPEEIVFGANMTTLTFHLGRALGREWREGDVVVVTELDHHANSDPWRALASERGGERRTVRVRREAGRRGSRRRLPRLSRFGPAAEARAPQARIAEPRGARSAAPGAAMAGARSDCRCRALRGAAGRRAHSHRCVHAPRNRFRRRRALARRARRLRLARRLLRGHGCAGAGPRARRVGARRLRGVHHVGRDRAAHRRRPPSGVRTLPAAIGRDTFG